MRPLFLLVMLLVFWQTSFGQTVLLHEGAHWEYLHNGTMGDPYNPIIRHSVSLQEDTIIQGEEAQKLLTQRVLGDVTGNPNGNYTYSSWFDFVFVTNDSVFVWADSSWEFVFDFDVQDGDERIVYLGYDDSGIGCVQYDTIQVDSTWSYDYLGETLVAIDYHLKAEDWQVHQTNNHGRYIERIGFISEGNPFVPDWCQNQVLHYLAPAFLCYSDDNLLSSGIELCSSTVDVRSLPKENEWSVNQANNLLRIENLRSSTVHIYDILGKELVQKRITSDNQVVDLSHLSNGILMVVVETEDGRLTKKVIKNSH